MMKGSSTLSFLIVFILMALSPAIAQQVVFSRSEVSTGEFGSAQLPWFYQSDNNSQGDPDNGDNVANLIRIGHNNNLNMTLNGRPYRAKELFFESTANSDRTFDGFPLELRYQSGGPTKIENQSTAVHTFNNTITIFDGVSEFNPVNGNLVFTGSILNNGNFIDVFGSETLTISGIVSGGGGIALKQNGTLILSADNTYTGGTFIENGTLKLSGNIVDSDVSIQNGAILEVEGNVTIKSLTVDTGGSVVIRPGQSLTVTNNLINNGDLTLESTSTTYSSLIADNVSGSGTTNYNRHVNNAADTGDTTAANDLISPPLSGMTFEDLRTANSNILSGTIAGGPTLYLFGHFDNGSANDYVLYGETPTDNAIVIDTGVGYRTGSTDGGTYRFTGGVETSSIFENITAPTDGSIWNLIGNPYPSYITVAEFLSINSGEFDMNSTGIYGYDGTAADGWTIYGGFTPPGTVIAPGQGFFVASKSGGGTVTFNPNMRSIGNSDDFIPMRPSSTTTSIKLNLSNAAKSFNTDIYFSEFSSLGLDPGYDASLFGGSAPSFAIYSHLVEDNNNIPFAIQALDKTGYGNSIIALGVNANQGEQLKFSITESTLPEIIEVYLDDNVLNTSTLLNSSDYVITPNNDLNGTGRFYLRFSESALSLNENASNNLNIHINKSKETIMFSGLILEPSIVKIYDVHGRSVIINELKNLSQTIDISSLRNGVYIVQISNTSQSKVQKVIISQ